MKKVQFNSVYVNDGQTVVTLFYDEQKNMMWYAIEMIGRGNGCGQINIEVSPELRAEIIDHSDRVWGCSQQLYYLKRFRSYLSLQLWDFIEECWEAIKRQEPELFPAKDEDE